MVRKKKKIFKREYIPIVIAILVLVVLILALVATLNYKEDDSTKNIEFDYKKEEIVIDNKNSKCNTDELNELYELAEKIEFSSEVVKIKTGTGIMVDQEGTPEVDMFGYVFDITLKNANDALYLKITNDANNDSTILKKENKKDGNYIFQTLFYDEIVTYTVEVYADKYDCKNEIVRKFTFKTPIYNSYAADNILCDDPGYKDFYYCQEWIETNVPTVQQFYNEVNLFLKNKKHTTTKVKLPELQEEEIDKQETTTKNTDKNKNEKKDKKVKMVPIIIGVVVFGLLVGCAIVATTLMKKRRSRVHEKK